MLTNSLVLIITITKTITIITNVSNSILNIIIIKSFIERSKRFKRGIIESRNARDEKDAKNDHKKSIS